VWLQLVRDPAAFGEGASLFEQAKVVWQKGLAKE
jgi:hypothetical protein